MEARTALGMEPRANVTVRATPEPSEYVADAWLLMEVPAGGGAACAGALIQASSKAIGAPRSHSQGAAPPMALS